MRVVALGALGLFLCGCATKKHVTDNVTDIKTEKTDSVVTQAVTINTTESISTAVSDSTATDVNVVEIHFDTTITDSVGNHPIKSIKHVTVKKSSGHKEATTQESETQQTDTMAVALSVEKNDSIVSAYEEIKESQGKARSVFFSVVIVGIMLGLLLMFAKWVDKNIKS